TAGVTEVVKIDVLAIAIDPWRDEAKPIELRARHFVAWSQIDAQSLAIEGHGDPAITAGHRIVLKGPVMRCAIRVNVRRIRTHAAAHPVPAISIDGIKIKSFTG